jgi:hypothetical protein
MDDMHFVAAGVAQIGAAAISVSWSVSWRAFIRAAKRKSRVECRGNRFQGRLGMRPCCRCQR